MYDTVLVPTDGSEVAVRAAADEAGLDSEPYGGTFGADSRHYQHAGIPTVLFGPGSIDQAHFPDESVRWAEVLTAGEVLVDAAERFLADSSVG